MKNCGQLGMNERQSIKSRSGRIAAISRSLAGELLGRTDSDFTSDLYALADKVLTTDKLDSDKNLSNQFKFGRRESWKSLEEFVDKHFIQIYELHQLVFGCDSNIKVPSVVIKDGSSFEPWHDHIQSIIVDLKSIGLIDAAIKFDAIRLVTLSMKSTAVRGEIRYCRYCFRRVVNKKNCHLHMAKDASFYLEVKKVQQNLDEDEWLWITKQRSLRGIIGEQPYKHSLYAEGGAIPKSIDQGDWSSASKILSHLFDSRWSNLKAHLDSKRGGTLFPLDQSFRTYYEFVEWLYSKPVLDNLNEDSTAAFWLMNNLFAAEEVIKASKVTLESCLAKRKNIDERESQILLLKGEGYSYREIAKTLGISKSLVGKLLGKYARTQQQ